MFVGYHLWPIGLTLPISTSICNIFDTHSIKQAFYAISYQFYLLYTFRSLIAQTLTLLN